MRRRNEPPGPSMVCSLTAATSAGGAINTMRASYCARAKSTGKVWVAGTPVPLSSNAWICGSTGIACSDPAGLLRGACEHRGASRKKAVERLPRTLVELRVIFAVKYSDAVDEHPVHADRVAQCTRSDGRQI